jgi:hypothetical protein
MVHRIRFVSATFVHSQMISCYTLSLETADKMQKKIMYLHDEMHRQLSP